MPDSEQPRQLTVEDRDLIRSDRRYDLYARAIRAGSIVACVALLANALKAFAGNETSVIVLFQTLITHNVTVTASLVFGFGGCGYGLWQRHLRRNNIERLQARVREYELRYDPHRTSSGLTSRGDTNPVDRIGGR